MREWVYEEGVGVRKPICVEEFSTDRVGLNSISLFRMCRRLDEKRVRRQDV